MSWAERLIGLATLRLWRWATGSRERLRADARPVERPDDPEAWLAVREAGIRPDVASYMQWAGAPGQVTDLAILYVHGFSASPAELRPLPERVARAVGANLLAIRLTGHGQGGGDLAAARVEDWWHDVGQGIAVAEGLGRRVVILGMSTGATLAAMAACEPQRGSRIAGVILISPNFALRRKAADVLKVPLARLVLRILGNPVRGFVPRNQLHRDGWTYSYPVAALLPVVALLRRARAGNYRSATVPALILWSVSDRIVDHRATVKVIRMWGGRVTVRHVRPGPSDDPDAHVIAGNALSPHLTNDLVAIIARWLCAESKLRTSG